MLPTVERCDGIDNDCDGDVDEDFDGDGDDAPRCDIDPCDQDCPEGDEDRCRAACDAQDCRDEDPSIYPAAADACGDGIDQNCDGEDAPCVFATGRVEALSIAEAGAERCLDANGDGAPDNAFALVGALANGAIEESIAAGQLNLFLSAEGLAPPGLDGAFELAVLTATAVEAGGYALDPASLDDDGEPMVRMPQARVREGDLRAGPGTLVLSIPVLGLDLVLAVSSTVVRGTVGVDEDLGLTVADGTIWGAVRHVDLEAAIDGIGAACEAAEEPGEVCGFLDQIRAQLGGFLQADEDLDGDDDNDAYSLCLSLAAAPAALSGWPAEEAE